VIFCLFYCEILLDARGIWIEPAYRVKITVKQGGANNAAGGEKTHSLGDERPQTAGGSVRAYGKPERELRRFLFIGEIVGGGAHDAPQTNCPHFVWFSKGD
jgi:hypothetical protein